MKSWIVKYVERDGLPSELQMLADREPSHEEAALQIRTLTLSPVLQEVDLNDFVGREKEPTAKWLEQQGIKILTILESAQ